jgi:hypothetical protein
LVSSKSFFIDCRRNADERRGAGSGARRGASTAENRYFLPESLARRAEIARHLAAQSRTASFTAAVFKGRSVPGC